MAIQVHQHVHLTAIGDVGAFHMNLQGLHFPGLSPVGPLLAIISPQSVTLFHFARALAGSLWRGLSQEDRYWPSSPTGAKRKKDFNKTCWWEIHEPFFYFR